MPASDLAGRAFLTSSSTRSPLTTVFIRLPLTNPS